MKKQSLLRNLFMSAALGVGGLMGLSYSADADASRQSLSGRAQGPEVTVRVATAGDIQNNPNLIGGARDRAALYAPYINERSRQQTIWDDLSDNIRRFQVIAGGVSYNTGIRGVRGPSWGGNSRVVSQANSALSRIGQIQDISRILGEAFRIQDRIIVDDHNYMIGYEKRESTQAHSMNRDLLERANASMVQRGEAQNQKFAIHPANLNVAAYTQRNGELAYLTFDASGGVVKVTDPSLLEQVDVISHNALVARLHALADPRPENQPRRNLLGY